VLAAAVAGSSMVFIDGAALTVALPALRESFSAGPGVLTWILNAYMLALAALTLIGGAAADRYGRKRVFSAGAVGFAAASVLCAIAPDAGWLIAGRALQGVFGALLTPAALALIAEAYPEKERGAAIGVWAASSALAAAGGPVFGGWLVETAGWRMIFLINLPIGALALGLALAAAPSRKPIQTEGGLDWLGAGLGALALGLAAWGLEGLAQADRDLLDAAPLLAGAGFGALFLWRERRAQSPILPLDLFKSRVFSGINLATFLLYAALSIGFFVLPVGVAAARSWSATEIGLVFLPFSLSVGLLSQLFGRLSDRIGAAIPMMAGASLAALGFGVMAVSAGDGPLWVGVIAPMTLSGLGFALLVPPLTATALSSAPEALAGSASGVNNAVARTASLAGVAVAAGLLAGGGEAGLPVFTLAFGLAAALCLAAELVILLAVRTAPQTRQ
jgi:EmrB/QacA subfamily drug resistance transporter